MEYTKFCVVYALTEFNYNLLKSKYEYHKLTTKINFISL